MSLKSQHMSLRSSTFDSSEYSVIMTSPNSRSISGTDTRQIRHSFLLVMPQFHIGGVGAKLVLRANDE